MLLPIWFIDYGGIMVRAVVQLVWGPSPERYTSGIHKAVTIFWDLKVKPDQFFIVALTLLLVVLVYLLLHRTQLGRAVRATVGWSRCPLW